MHYLFLYLIVLEFVFKINNSEHNGDFCKLCRETLLWTSISIAKRLYLHLIFNFKCCLSSNVSSQGDGIIPLLFYSASIYRTRIISQRRSTNSVKSNCHFSQEIHKLLDNYNTDCCDQHH